MKKQRTTRQGRAAFGWGLAVLLLATGCGSGFATNSGSGGGGGGGTPSGANTVVYTIDGANKAVLAFTITSGVATQTAAIQLPVALTAVVLATDANDNIYVGGYTTDLNTTEVLVYPAGSTGDVNPRRTVVLESGQLTAMTVDANGDIYAAQLNTLASVKEYAASASGTSTAIKVLNPSQFLYLNDVAVDATGNVYVSGYNGGAYFIEEYAASAAGNATALNTMYAPAGSYFGGIAVDASGNIWAMEQLTIVEFPPNSNGTPSPTTAINLEGPVAPYTSETYSNVLRLNAAGDLFVPLTQTAGTQSQSLIFEFAPTESGNATPVVSFIPGSATQSTPLGINIPLAVF